MDPGAFLINRTLERERWARDKLALHAGRTVSFKLGPASVTWKIDESGSFHETKESPDLTLTLSPLRLPSLLAQPARWHELVEASGDSALATTLEELSLTLPMLVEQAFTRALGPIAGAFVADSQRHVPPALSPRAHAPRRPDVSVLMQAFVGGARHCAETV